MEKTNETGAARSGGKKLGKFCIKLVIITLGALIYAIGTAFFISPQNLAPGGVSGLSVVIRLAFIKLFDIEIPVGVFVLIINIPLLIIGLIKFGKEFIVGTMYGTVILSVLIALFEKLRDYMLEPYLNSEGILEGPTPWFVVENPILCGIAGGALMAIGLGIVFKVGATTGGTDIIVKLLRLKYKHVHTGKIFLFIDVCIALSSLPVVDFKIETVMYSLVAIVVCSTTLDLVLYGTDGAKLVYIISDKSEQIAKRVLIDLNLGGTFLDAEGAYTREKKEVLMCVVKKHLFPKLKDIVREEDSKAFFIVSSANEIFGEGFKDHFNDEI